MPDRCSICCQLPLPAMIMCVLATWPVGWLQELEDNPAKEYTAGAGQPNWLYQTSVLTYRTFLNK